MRKYFLTLTLCLLAVNISAAQDVDFSRLISTFSEKFVGTWKYESEDYSMIITFKKGMIGNIEFLFGTYQIDMDGQRFEDFRERCIMGSPTPVDDSEGSYSRRKFNTNEIICTLYREGFAASRFTLSMKKGYSDRAILTQVRYDENGLGGLRIVETVSVQVANNDESVVRKRLYPTGKLLPPDGTVLFKQKK